MAQSHFYSSTMPRNTLAGAALAADATILLPSAAYINLPGGYPFTLRLDPGLTTEELVDVTGAASPSGANVIVPVTRGVDGTTARAHILGAGVEHSLVARDLNEAGAHVGSLIAGDPPVHGLAAGDYVASGGSLASHSAHPWLVYGTYAVGTTTDASGYAHPTFTIPAGLTARMMLISPTAGFGQYVIGALSNTTATVRTWSSTGVATPAASQGIGFGFVVVCT